MNVNHVEAKSTRPIRMFEWQEVDRLLPKYSKFIVKDIETGKQFRVQRRAGSNHADVQPLTPKDTKIMKEIYGGKWSWKRRAILILDKKYNIAASMHGMPHGAGALPNNFPGHFCIHFYGSTTHRTNFMDLSHKLMILKAAGQLEQYLSTPDPYEVVSAYITGFKQQDEKIVSAVSIQKREWEDVLKRVENVAISNMPILPEEDLRDELSLTIPIEIEWYIEGTGRRVYSSEINIVRFSPKDAWKIDSDTFLQENRLN